MRQVFILALILPFCYAIDIKFYNQYSNGIKRIEVTSCVKEPCLIIKGQPLEAKITFETTYPEEVELKDVKDVEATVFLDQYRGQYIYNLAEIKSFCKNQSINCPLALHKNYTMNASLFLSVDDGQHYAFGSGNGKYDVFFTVVLNSSNDGTVIGASVARFNIQSTE